MIEKLENIYVGRIERFAGRITRSIPGRSIDLSAQYAVTAMPVVFGERESLDYSRIKTGDMWGRAWDNAWFTLTGEIPKDWQGSCVVAHLDFSGEGLVFHSDGGIVQGISNGSIFDAEFSRDMVRLYDRCEGGEQVTLWVEATASGLFGVRIDPEPPADSPNRYGSYEASVKAMRLCEFDRDLWHLWLDVKTALGLIRTTPKNGVRRARLIRSVNDAIDAYADTRTNLETCREILAAELYKPAAPSDLSVCAVGHAHIDTAWLWPIRETIRKCARTFASQLRLMESYPEYVFGASQPRHYDFVKTYYPDLYDRIKQAVADGHWEVQGGMWVEADCNVIGGESMIRQILHGKNFFKDEFDIDVDNLWLPDVFGYSAALPQILIKSGITYFLTQKLSWNQINEFPYQTFLWEGIDGSRVLSHFPPENNYNSQLGPEYLVPARDAFKEKDRVDEFISLFGVGDGGGGPKEENIELGRRMENLEGAPRVKFGKAADFFERLATYENTLPTWVGELYLELHRGTLTTHGRVKKANRRMECDLRTAEMLWSMLPLDEYPAERFNEIWKRMLTLQFHDILPGSSITKVYNDAHREYDEIGPLCQSLILGAAEKILDSDEKSMTLFNDAAYDFTGAVKLPDDWRGGGLCDETGTTIPVQAETDGTHAMVTIPAYSFVTLRHCEHKVEKAKHVHDLILENDVVRYEFVSDGKVCRAYDKEYHRELIPEGSFGNRLTLYDDYPNNWDAWDIDVFYEKCLVDKAQASGIPVKTIGPVRQKIEFGLTVGNSKITQTAILMPHSKRLDFLTTVDWRENHRMLRVAFPTIIRSDQAAFDIQYGYLMRNTHRNTSWDTAKFEVCGHRYADISDRDYGVALLNDCKYGYKVYEGTLDLNLLRSPTNPDPDADRETHVFTYSLFPHAGDVIHSQVMAEAAQINQPPQMWPGKKAGGVRLPWYLDAVGIMIGAVKKAEKENCLILRLVETLGRHSKGTLRFNANDIRVCETDLMEWKDGSEIAGDKSIDISMKPFEIKTFKLRG